MQVSEDKLPYAVASMNANYFYVNNGEKVPAALARNNGRNIRPFNSKASEWGSAAGADAFVVRNLFEDVRNKAPAKQPHPHEFNYDQEVLTYEDIRDIISRLEYKARLLGIRLINDLENFSAPPSGDSQPLCSEPWKALYVLRRGISPCCYSSATPVGHWSERGDRSIEEFVADTFNSEIMQDIRASLARGKLANFCKKTASCPFLKKADASHRSDAKRMGRR